jgi:butyrate kinase
MLMEEQFRILAVNPGSTSTKISIFDGTSQLAAETLRHDASSLQRFPRVWDQLSFRLHTVREWAFAHTSRASAVIGMGGLLRPVQGGTYRVNERMLSDARANLQGEHASNLGCAIADMLAREFQCGAFVADPVSVDEFEPLARYSGHPLIQRSSLSHALSLHAAAARAAAELNIPIEHSSLIIAHLGGGISVAPVRSGRIIDINDASSDGPFSPERTGGLPLQQFITLCYSGTTTEQETRKLVMGRGGLSAYLGTNSALEVETRIANGDATAREVYEAMAYQIAKEIGAMATVLRGKVQASVITGGLAGSSLLVGWITERIRFIAPVLVYPGEDEMGSLALAALRILRGETPVAEY